MRQVFRCRNFSPKNGTCYCVQLHGSLRSWRIYLTLYPIRIGDVISGQLRNFLPKTRWWHMVGKERRIWTSYPSIKPNFVQIKVTQIPLIHWVIVTDARLLATQLAPSIISPCLLISLTHATRSRRYRYFTKLE